MNDAVWFFAFLVIVFLFSVLIILELPSALIYV